MVNGRITHYEKGQHMTSSNETNRIMQDLKKTLDNWEPDNPFKYLISLWECRANRLESQLRFVNCQDSDIWSKVAMWRKVANELKVACIIQANEGDKESLIDAMRILIGEP